MSIQSYANCLKTTALKNPIASSATDILTKLNTIPVTNLTPEALEKLNLAKQKLQEQVEQSTSWLSGVKDNLPLLKASDAANNKLKIMQGITPSAVGGDGVKSVSNVLESATQTATQFKDNIAQSIDNVDVSDLDALEILINDISNGVESHTSAIAQNITAVSDTIKGAVSDLKDYAFAKFSAMPQPPALSELMSKILPDTCQAPRAEIINSEEQIANEVIEKKYEQAINPPSSTSTDLFDADAQEKATNAQDIPAPSINGKTPQQLKDSVYEQIDALYDKKKELRLRTTELLVETRNKKYQLYPDYDKVKQLADDGDLDAIRKYDQMLEDMRRVPPFLTWQQKHEELEQCDTEIRRLESLLKSWAMNNYQNVPEGPPW